MAGLSTAYNSLLKKTTYGTPPAAPIAGPPAGAGAGGVAAHGAAANQDWYTRTSTPTTGSESFLLATQGPDALAASQEARRKAAEEDAFQTDLTREIQTKTALEAPPAGAVSGGPTVNATGSYGGGGAGGGGGLTVDQLKDLMATLGVSAGGTAGAGAPGPTLSAPARIEMPAAPDTRGAEAAAWARAKDVIGRQTRGALGSLKELQAARGFGPESGVYAEQEANLLGEGLRSLGETSRTQAEDALAAERARASEGFQGAITQRGQDIGVLGAGFSGAITQRGQDLQLQLAELGLLPAFLALLRRSQAQA